MRNRWSFALVNSNYGYGNAEVREVEIGIGSCWSFEGNHGLIEKVRHNPSAWLF